MITHPSPSSPFFVSSSSPPPTLLSFPTRRSSDLGVLVFAYSLGLGIPFIAGAMLLSRSTRALGFLRRHRRAFQRLGGGLLVLLGLAMVTGLWTWVSSYLQGLVANFQTLEIGRAHV